MCVAAINIRFNHILNNNLMTLVDELGFRCIVGVWANTYRFHRNMTFMNWITRDLNKSEILIHSDRMEWNGKQTMRTNRNIFFAGYGIDFKPLQMFTNQPQQRQILKIRDLTVFDVIIVDDSSNKQLYLLNIWPRCESQSVILTSISFCIHLSLGLVSFSLERKRFSDTDLHSLKKKYQFHQEITYANSFICDSCC